MAEEDAGGITSCRLWLLQLFVLLGLLVLFIWLGIRPKSPGYTITQFSVDNGTIAFSIEIDNPNKDSEIHFANVNCSCYNNQQFLGSVLFASFNQDKQDKTPLTHTIVLDDKVWKALEVEIKRRKAQLWVTLVTEFRYRTWGIMSPRQKVNQKGPLAIGPDGKLPGKQKLNNGSKKWRIKMT